MKKQLFILLSLFPFWFLSQNYSADSTFDFDGKVITPMKESASFGFGAALQPDGKLLLTGELDDVTYGSGAFITYRLDQAGQLDMTFGDTGRVITKYNLLSKDKGNTIAIQPDGKILVGGGGNSDAPAGLNPEYNFALVRYNSNGSLDNSFGAGGKVETDLGDIVEEIKTLILQGNGSILAGGELAIIKYTSTGQQDPSFGIGGIVNIDYRFGSMIQQPDGKIVVAGYSWDNATGNDFVVARYTTNGLVDNTFGTNGRTRIDFGTIHDYGVSLHLRNNGNIVITGNSTLGDGKNKFAAAELFANGTLNTAFGVSGKAIALPDLRESFVNKSFMVPGSNNLLICGNSWLSFAAPSRAIIMKLDSTGQFDYTFNTFGFISYQHAGQVSHFNDLLVQPNGKLVAVGSSDQPGGIRLLARRYKLEQALPPVATGISEPITLNEGIRIYPNPSASVVHFQYSNPSGQVMNLEIFDLSGRLLLTQKIRENEGAQIEVSEFEPGAYWVKVSGNGGKTLMKNFIVGK